MDQNHYSGVDIRAFVKRVVENSDFPLICCNIPYFGNWRGVLRNIDR